MLQRRSTVLCLSLLLLASAPTARADVKLPALFSDHLVLQRSATVPVWGWADPGEEVSVTIAGQTKAVTTDAAGKWTVKLADLPAGGPHTLAVKGKNSLTINDVLVGEVWVGSGQSNMAMTVDRANDFDNEKAAAKYPQIRMFKTTTRYAETPQTDCMGKWEVCSPEAVGKFSATAYFFGRKVHNALQVPVGLIVSAVGGTPIESWIDGKAQRATPQLKGFFDTRDKSLADFDPAAAKAQYERALTKWQAAAAKAKSEKKPAPRKPQDPVQLSQRKADIGGLYNGMIAPLIPFAIRGVLWYQGEANSQTGKAEYYQHHLSLLTRDWRSRWGQGDFPVAWVQLPNFTRPGDGWMLVREGMLKSLAVPNTGMAITIDIGDPRDIHPKNKQDVGKRLALWALADVYKQPGISASGPLPAGHQVQGSEIILSFQHANGGLVAHGDATLKGFVIAGADKQWKPAQARIVGEKIVVSHPAIPQPVAVRYAWQDNPDANLYNAAGLPASPFRTDEW